MILARVSTGLSRGGVTNSKWKKGKVKKKEVVSDCRK